ncbi:lysophospholipid acyltransferase family protein [Deinococcus sp. QL22]|nr:lysophospholipid acyltransferase family protein [Deinococcus sp. QL22]UQN07821.1 lysophospholipid acyltransferase family protein [Deinococcus sp. QL22]
MVRHSIRRSVQGQLAGVWVRGTLPAFGPTGGAVLAPNHHSWWDGYVVLEVAAWAGADFRVLMTAHQLGRFPFLRRAGALAAGQVREAARFARAGSWMVVFPEGAVRPAGPLQDVRAGAAWVARTARVPLVPVALRVLMRGGQQPEAYLRFGSPVSEALLPQAMMRELALLDAELADADPEQPLAGYLRVCGRRVTPDDPVSLPARMLTLITGDR